MEKAYVAKLHQYAARELSVPPVVFTVLAILSMLWQPILRYFISSKWSKELNYWPYLYYWDITEGVCACGVLAVGCSSVPDCKKSQERGGVAAKDFIFPMKPVVWNIPCFYIPCLSACKPVFLYETNRAMKNKGLQLWFDFKCSEFINFVNLYEEPSMWLEGVSKVSCDWQVKFYLFSRPTNELAECWERETWNTVFEKERSSRERMTV